jgi:NAD(P)-dependent dehydrogenase (short-subunit alcohol dehydrogenase family)
MADVSNVAVVTGASKGIGRAIALELASRGYRVAILDPLASGAEVAREVKQRSGDSLYLSTDVADETAVGDAVSAVQEQLGTPRVLVNNAGIYPRGAALDIPLETWWRTIQVNLGGTFLCSRAFARGMLQAGGGVIVNTGSGRAIQGAVNGSHYAASKAAIVNLTRSLAQEWAPLIRVNTIIPGITDTDQPREGLAPGQDLYAAGASIPLGRIAQPEDIARAVAFLVSPEATYITGQSLCVNGGAILQ